MKNPLTPTDESVLQMSAVTLRSLGHDVLANEIDRIFRKVELAFSLAPPAEARAQQKSNDLLVGLVKAQFAEISELRTELNKGSTHVI